jgi:hypothetical protein
MGPVAAVRDLDWPFEAMDRWIALAVVGFELDCVSIGYVHD